MSLADDMAPTVIRFFTPRGFRCTLPTYIPEDDRHLVLCTAYYLGDHQQSIATEGISMLYNGSPEGNGKAWYKGSIAARSYAATDLHQFPIKPF